MQSKREDVTQLLEAVHAGSDSAVSDLFVIVYDELRALARAHMVAEPAGHTLQPTALVHEAFLRLVGSQEADDGASERPWGNRAYFFAAAGQAMRRILVERARRVGALKRGAGARKVTLDEGVGLEASPDLLVDVLAIDQALEELQGRSPELAEVAELRFFVGLTAEEVAEVLQTSKRSVERRWTAARAFLLSRLRS